MTCTEKNVVLFCCFFLDPFERRKGQKKKTAYGQEEHGTKKEWHWSQNEDHTTQK
jgi:hypothetical protein